MTRAPVVRSGAPPKSAADTRGQGRPSPNGKAGLDLSLLHLRPAHIDDAACLAALGMQVFLDTYATQGISPAIAREALHTFSHVTWQTRLASTPHHITAAEINGHLLGFSQLAVGARHGGTPDPTAAELCRLYVQERFTGQGVGRALLHAAQAQAKTAGAQHLWLTAWVDNLRARQFYAAQGYQDQGPVVFSFEGSEYENRLFHKAL